jgi:hypothetical protein
VLADVLTDLVLATAKDDAHAYRLFTIIDGKIEGRWRAARTGRKWPRPALPFRPGARPGRRRFP